METVVRVEGNDEGKLEESGIKKISSPMSSIKQISNPVVYKLVRVEGDGRLVPATDDEVMEVVDLLKNEKSEMHIVGDNGQTVRCISNEDSPRNSQPESPKGLSDSGNTEADTEKLNAQAEETVPSLVVDANDIHTNQSGNVAECLNPPGGEVESGSSDSAVYTSSKPDFSMLKGEICLDNLSIRELHETFKATFGRETTVKDKAWLRRRIAMGLTNSCHVSTTTTLIIKDNKLVNKDKEESSKDVDFIEDSRIGATNDSCKDSPINHHSHLEDDHVVTGKILSGHVVEYDCGSEDLTKEQSTNKRIRKPTRRYIEELSEVELREHGGRLAAFSKNSRIGDIYQKSSVRPVRNVSADRRSVVTRLDSLGGSGVQVPFVYRVRRSRPRKNVMTLMKKLHPSSMGMSAKCLGVCSSQPGSESGNRIVEDRDAPGQIQQPSENKCSEMDTIELKQNAEPRHVDSSGDTSDDNIATVPTAKGGIRRKHHRAWTLSEVMKLVEGVSRYGAGRWSEIKRLAFASYSYRTSVDLKDKWRNLLKASFAPTPSDKGMNSRKQGSMPIPAPILLRVRELAEMQSQVPTHFSSSKLGGGISDRSAHESRLGYL